ncbi:MAG: hypothetical protein OER43_16020 [Gammaproteobacteria bacterium]|nr:hypothetical protein [Gammaproteobacteria bacterium]
MTRLSIILLLTALIAGCVTPYSLVNPERQTVGGVISVQPSTKWNKASLTDYQGSLEVWTLDGPTLNTLVFFTGVPDGEPLFTRRSQNPAQQEKPPVFRSTMNALEIQELLEATVARYFQTTLAEGRNLRSETIAEGRGFRFETKLVGRDEVERVGVFVGTIRHKKLYGAWFQGARLHYFERYRPEFDRLVKSARLVGEAAK